MKYTTKPPQLRGLLILKMEELTTEQVKNILISMAESPSVSPKDIQNFFDKFLVLHPQPILNITSPFLVRCGINDNSPNAKSEDVVFQNKSRCSYPPESRVKLQRCNYDNQSLFYAALPCIDPNAPRAELVAILETGFDIFRDKEINNYYFTVSKWNIKSALSLVVLPFSTIAFNKNSDYRSTNEQFKKHLKAITSTNEDYEYWFSFLTFMSDVFCQIREKEKYYKISSAFFNSIIKLCNNGGKIFIENEGRQELNYYQIDGIMYPSANTEASGINICLKKEVIDNSKVEMELAVMYKMNRDKNSFKSLTLVPASSIAIPDELGNLCFKSIW